MVGLKEKISRIIIMYGSKNLPITNEQICVVLGIPYGNDRNGPKIRRAVEQLRKEGHPICARSSGKFPGYWYAESEEELLAYELRLENRILAIQTTRQALREWRERRKIMGRVT